MSGDWPNLSDRMPDPADRNRAIERADPSVTPRQQDTEPQTPAEAQELFVDVENALLTTRTAFDESWQRFRETENATIHEWMEAQLALTRLSQTSSRLNIIIFNEALDGSPVHAQARALKDQIDSVVISARKQLADSRPADVS